MIDIQSLTFGYSRSTLMQDFSLRLQSGRIYGLFGKNGAGKTTLLKLISGQRYADTGQIDVYGQDPKERSSSFLTECFFLPEEPYIPEISLEAFVKMYASFYPSFSLDQFFQILNEFELPRKIHFKKLSMGQRKKAFIAYALACNTRVLIMDEPTNGLDIPSKRQFRKILSHILTDDRIFVISTHQVRDLHSIIDHVLMINEGKLIFDHSIADIMDHLTFTISRRQPSDDDYLYYDRVPGGYLCISGGSDMDSLEPDIETLFNAILSETELIQSQFQTIKASS